MRAFSFVLQVDITYRVVTVIRVALMSYTVLNISRVNRYKYFIIIIHVVLIAREDIFSTLRSVRDIIAFV